jgi:hypothetical protein
MPLRFLPILALAATALLPVAARSAAPPPLAKCDSLRLVNQTGSRVRITFFDIRDQARQRPGDGGWLEACSFRDWLTPPIYAPVPKPIIGFLCGSTVYIRAQAPDNPSAGDAWAVMSPRQQDIARDPLAYSKEQEKWLRMGAGGKYVWTSRAEEWDPQSPTPRPLYCQPASRP